MCGQGGEGDSTGTQNKQPQLQMITWRGLALCEILGHFIFCRKNTYWTKPKSPTIPQACFKRPQIPSVDNHFWWELTDPTAIDVSSQFLL